MRTYTSRGIARLGHGFTLIELMIAVAILAIVMAIAIPSYNEFVTRSNRAEAKALLMNAAQALERCYTRFSAYNAGECPVAFPQTSENEWYQLPEDEQAVAATTYTLVAVPQGVQASRDTKCANFTLTHTGARGVSGSGSVDDCW
ncbi:MAG: type IV pilin protein [Pseudomonadota bacterium]|nr:MAG: type IV pilin protein [Pseudomonadota bacterium]